MKTVSNGQNEKEKRLIDNLQNVPAFHIDVLELKSKRGVSDVISKNIG